jgi:hypothetical protein
LYFWRSSYMHLCGQNYPRAEVSSADKKVCFAHRILVFHFFDFFFCSWFCMMSPSMWPLQSKCKVLILFKKFYKVQNLEVLSQDPKNKKIFGSFTFTNMELRFEPCMLNLIWKWCAKDPRKREDHLIFISFGEKKFTVKNIPKKINFVVWML